ncbi:hypothetical protein Lal_00002515 [Lupinus albus]|nr:hypothetical protein Lal_00002515 [Lupinus albus]
MTPDHSLLAKIDTLGIIVTAPGKDVDFVSRFFAPAAGVPEDPVTGSAHCNLIPYWANKLGKDRLHAYQVSPRKGELWCEFKGDRVVMAGKAVTYLSGSIVSFGDKITINFNEGVTAIAGPNGCGKSNVVDAIRWVLGEQSTRMLRSERWTTLFLTVTLTRRLYRSGESEYRLNDVQCRLKDITDLFMDTGVGADSYSIIELRMIDEIINNKEGSRRNLFEEASGISKYKLRKKQTFSKLKDTEADLERVEDLLFEIEKNLKTLENQAKKTERYYRLKEQYKTLSISLASFRIANFSRSLAQIEEKEQVQKVEKTGIVSQIDTLEADLQKSKVESITKEKNLAAQQKPIRAYESEKRIKNEQLKHQQDKESRLKDELERDNTQYKHVQYNIKRLNEEKLQEDENLQTISAHVQELKEAVDELKAQQAEARNELNELNAVNNRLQSQLYKAEKDIDILNIQQQALEQESQRNMEDTTNKEAELSHFNTVVAELQNRVETLKGEYELAVDAENKLKEQIAETEASLKTVTESIATDSRRLDARQNEYNLTKSLVDNLEGFPESIRFLKKTTGWAKTVTLFSDILFCKEEFRVAIENYLEPFMNHYVVNNYDEAIAAINLLSNAAKGRAQFFILIITRVKNKQQMPA